MKFEIRAEMPHDELTRLLKKGCDVDCYDITSFDGSETVRRYRVLYPLVPKEEIE